MSDFLSIFIYLFIFSVLLFSKNPFNFPREVNIGFFDV